jgi:lysophospholipase L1-like esterase
MNSDKIYLAVVPLFFTIGRPGAKSRRVRYAAERPPKGAVVFLGDSLAMRGRWHEWFPDLTVANRGIDGDTTVDLRERLDESLNEPSVVSLIIGTNDLHAADALRDLDGIASRVDDIVSHISHVSPKTRILINSVLPRTSLLTPQITTLNDKLRIIARERGQTFVDLWPGLAVNGALRSEFTRDNLHLTSAGYAEWVSVLSPLISPRR